MNESEGGIWYLTFVFGQQNDLEQEPTTVIRAFKPICFETFSSDRAAIQEYHRSLRLIKSVQLNIQEFLQSIVNHGADFLESRNMNDTKFDFVSLNLTRQLLNVLSMFRCLLDHSDFSLSREFGKDSDEYLQWKTIQAEQYDNFFEYRLFYKLRNYCQHIGVPPMHISFSDSAESEGIAFGLDIERDVLLEEASVWNTQLINDLKAASDKIPVLSCLETWSTCFRAISKELLSIRRKTAECAALRVVGYRKENDLPTDVGQLCVVLMPASKEKIEHLKLNLHWLPEKQANELLENNFFKDRADSEYTNKN
jgi:hypothetical protein